MTLLGPVSPRPAFLRHSFPSAVPWAKLLHSVIFITPGSWYHPPKSMTELLPDWEPSSWSRVSRPALQFPLCALSPAFAFRDTFTLGYLQLWQYLGLFFIQYKSSSIAIIDCFWSWIKISWSPCWFVVFKFGLNLVIYPGCCVPFSLALLCSTWYALTVKGRRWILWHSKREQKGAQLSPSWACTLHCKSGKRRLTNLFAFAFALLVHNKYSLILWTKLYLPFWCMALICPLLSKLDQNYTWYVNCAFDFTQILESCNSTIWLQHG